MSQTSAEAPAATSDKAVKPTSKLAVVGRWLAGLVGLIMLLGGVGAVMFGNWNPPPEPPQQVVRPVKTAVVVDAASLPARRFPGQILAGKTVDLSFQVGGPLLESDLKLGRELLEGDVLARIDPVRYEQQIAVMEPQIDQLRIKLERIEKLMQANAATAQELTDAKAAYQGALAQLKIAQQSLTDTILKAPFRAIIVQRFVENFQNIQPGTPVARLQDISSLDLAVDLPEALVALYKRNTNDEQGDTKRQKPQVVFSVLPDKSFEVKVKEASAEADPATGMYRVIFTMARPKEITALPGMAVTLQLSAYSGTTTELVIPSAALWVDETGAQRVWRLIDEGGESKVRSIKVEVDRLNGDSAIVNKGLEPGEVVVTAGVSMLRDGQKVRRMESQP